MRQASDGDRWAEIARANEREKKGHKDTESGKERERERGGTEPPACAGFLFFFQTTGVLHSGF